MHVITTAEQQKDARLGLLPNPAVFRVWPPLYGMFRQGQLLAPGADPPAPGVSATHDGYKLTSPDFNAMDVQALSIQGKLINNLIPNVQTVSVPFPAGGTIFADDFTLDVTFIKVGPVVTIVVPPYVANAIHHGGITSNYFTLPDSSFLPAGATPVTGVSFSSYCPAVDNAAQYFQTLPAPLNTNPPFIPLGGSGTFGVNNAVNAYIAVLLANTETGFSGLSNNGQSGWEQSFTITYNAQS